MQTALLAGTKCNTASAGSAVFLTPAFWQRVCAVIEWGVFAFARAYVTLRLLIQFVNELLRVCTTDKTNTVTSYSCVLIRYCIRWFTFAVELRVPFFKGSYCTQRPLGDGRQWERSLFFRKRMQQQTIYESSEKLRLRQPSCLTQPYATSKLNWPRSIIVLSFLMLHLCAKPVVLF